MNKDIEFLKALQEELKTQDHDCQAAPRFWVVRGTIREYGIDGGFEDGEELINDGDNVAETVSEAIKYIKDYYKDELKELKIAIRKDAGCYEFSVNRGLYVKEIDDLDDIAEFLNEYKLGDFLVAKYRNIKKNYENTMFLTKVEAQNHIKSNYYHYPKDAHTYAMTAWRAPKVEKLMKILETFDWDSINS